MEKNLSPKFSTTQRVFCTNDANFDFAFVGNNCFHWTKNQMEQGALVMWRLQNFDLLWADILGHLHEYFHQFFPLLLHSLAPAGHVVQCALRQGDHAKVATAEVTAGEKGAKITPVRSTKNKNELIQKAETLLTSAGKASWQQTNFIDHVTVAYGKS